MQRRRFACPERTHPIIDAIPGSGGMFSLERLAGRRFITRSRLHTAGEFARLPPVN